MTRSICVLMALSLVGCQPESDPDEPAWEGGDGGDGGDGGSDTGDPVDDRTRVTILHTNDWQSHMLGWGPNAEYTPETTGDDTTVGGLARAATLVSEIRGASSHPVMLLDGGDWMGGALFQELRGSHSAELQVMAAMGYDAAAIGNHEFDWGPDGLAELITTAADNGATVPLLAANLVPSAEDSGDDAYAAHVDSGAITDAMVLTLDDGTTVGLFGLLGQEAYDVAPAALPLSLTPPEDAAGATVDGLLAQDVDLVVALTHNGVTDDPSTSPDELLAQAVPAIDVIVGGHSHTPLHQYRTAGEKTVVLQAGAYTRYLGELTLVQEEDGAWTVEAYTLHELDDSIPGDPTVLAMVDEFRAALDTDVLPALETTFDASLIGIPGDVGVVACAESGLGDLITDAYRWKLSELDPSDPIDVAFESQGVIRDDFVAGETGVQAFSDVFRVLPLGFGTDDRPGYALVDFYATGQELAYVCEVSASVAPLLGCNYQIEWSGMRCTYDAAGGFLFKVQGVDLWNEGAGEYQALDISGGDEALYHVTVDSYVASLVDTISDLTSGVLNIVPKDAEGNPVSASTQLFDADPETEGVQEVKLWEALRDYSLGFADTTGDGVADLPESYLSADGRFVAE